MTCGPASMSIGIRAVKNDRLVSSVITVGPYSKLSRRYDASPSVKNPEQRFGRKSSRSQKIKKKNVRETRRLRLGVEHAGAGRQQVCIFFSILYLPLKAFDYVVRRVDPKHDVERSPNNHPFNDGLRRFIKILQAVLHSIKKT